MVAAMPQGSRAMVANTSAHEKARHTPSVSGARRAQFNCRDLSGLLVGALLVLALLLATLAGLLRLLSGLLSTALLSGLLLAGGLLILLAGLLLLARLLGLIGIIHLGYLTVKAEQPLT